MSVIIMFLMPVSISRTPFSAFPRWSPPAGNSKCFRHPAALPSGGPLSVQQAIFSRGRSVELNPLLARKGPSGAASGGGKKFLEFPAGGDEREKSKTNVQ